MDDSKKITHWLEVAKKINSIAQTGLAYTKDEYDKLRYAELLDMSLAIINNITGIDRDKLDFVFNRDEGYQTPKIGVRAVVCRDDQILLVRERMDGKWTLPGGWADTGKTPSETAITEVKEEAGYDVKPLRILALKDYNKHQQRQFPFDVYCLFMECEIVGGKPAPGEETSDVRFFSIDKLPELSERRVTREQILEMYHLANRTIVQPVFD